MLTTDQAAKLLQVSPQRIRQLCAAGRIFGAQRIGYTWIIPDKPQIIAAPRGRPAKQLRKR